MNKQRRKQLGEALKLLDEAIEKLNAASEIVSDAASEEQDYYDCMPESLQGSERGYKAEEAASNLNEVADALLSAMNEVDTQKGQIEYAME